MPNSIAGTAVKKVVDLLKQPAKVNWLFIAGVALVANLVGAIFHF